MNYQDYLQINTKKWEFHQILLTGKPERSAYFLAGLNEGGASMLLSGDTK